MYNPTHQLDEDELDEHNKIEEKWDMYNQQEASIKAQILTTIPESLAVRIQALDIGKKLWDCQGTTVWITDLHLITGQFRDHLQDQLRGHLHGHLVDHLRLISRINSEVISMVISLIISN